MTPSPATWRAMVLNAASTPARSVFESMIAGIGSRTDVDATFRIRPQPRSRIPGITAPISASGASTSERCAASHCSRENARASGPAGGPPVLQTRTSMGPPSASCGGGHEAGGAVDVAAVPDQARRADLARGGGDALLRAGRDGHARALRDQGGRDPAADPLRRAGDQGGTPLETQVHDPEPY